MLDSEILIDRLVSGMREAASELPPDVKTALEKAMAAETSETARMQLEAILKNVELALDGKTPLCQDTGVQLFFVKAGYDFPYLNEVRKAIPIAIEKATTDIPLRPNTVNPFTGRNPGNNLGPNMPAVTIELVDGDECKVIVFPKGGGSENMSALWMLTPAEGFKGMKQKVLDHIVYASGKPCPPIVIGIGIGGGADIAVKLAKKALLRPLDERHAEQEVAEMEAELLEDINSLGIGPMGLGGRATALAVNIEYTNRHPATFPTAMVVQCWCDRRSILHINRDGEVS